MPDIVVQPFKLKEYQVNKNSNSRINIHMGKIEALQIIEDISRQLIDYEAVTIHIRTNEVKND